MTTTEVGRPATPAIRGETDADGGTEHTPLPHWLAVQSHNRKRSAASRFVTLTPMRVSARPLSTSAAAVAAITVASSTAAGKVRERVAVVWSEKRRWRVESDD